MTWWVAGAVVVGGALQSDASRRGANQQSDTASAASAEQRRQFDLLREDQTPYREAGADAISQLRGLAGFNPTLSAAEVMNEPGYQFGLDQGRNAIQGTAAARGGLYSGNALRELTQYGGDYATTRYGQAHDRAQQAFGNRWNRLAGLAGIGQTSVQQTGNAGMNTAMIQGNLMTGAANAQAASGMQRAGIWGNGINQLAGMAAYRSGQPQQQNIWQPGYGSGYDSYGGYTGWTGDH